MHQLKLQSTMNVVKRFSLAFGLFLLCYFSFTDIHEKFVYFVRVKNKVDLASRIAAPASNHFENINFDSTGIMVRFPAELGRNVKWNLSDNVESARIWVKTEAGIKFLKYSKFFPKKVDEFSDSKLSWILVLATGYSEKDSWWNPRYVISIEL